MFQSRVLRLGFRNHNAPYALVFCRTEGTIRFFMGVESLDMMHRRVRSRSVRSVEADPMNEALEASGVMSESEQRTGMDRAPLTPAPTGYDDEEPPSRPRRHPLWQHDPRPSMGRLALAIAKRHPLRPPTARPAAVLAEELEAIGAWKASTSSPSRRITSRSSTPTTRSTRSGCSRSPARWKPRTRPATNSKTRSKKTRTCRCRA